MSLTLSYKHADASCIMLNGCNARRDLWITCAAVKYVVAKHTVTLAGMEMHPKARSTQVN